VNGKEIIRWPEAWSEARRLVSENRGRLALGLVLMLISRLAGLVLPASSKILIDDVIGKHRHDLLPLLALGAGIATLIDGIISFSLSQVLGVAAQHAITDMRRSVACYVLSCYNSRIANKLAANRWFSCKLCGISE
jgi:ABC-type bacteriocin/lantibiotic exporter with double-glycine peptidase domain